MKTTSSRKKPTPVTPEGAEQAIAAPPGRGCDQTPDDEDYPSGDEEDREGYVGPDKRGRPRKENSVGLSPKP